MKLKKWVEYTLSMWTAFLFGIGISVVDLSLIAIPFYLLLWTVVCFNILFIKKYGKGVIFNEK